MDQDASVHRKLMKGLHNVKIVPEYALVGKGIAENVFPPNSAPRLTALVQHGNQQKVE